jgi:AcrR family transcriptional regulator
MLSIPAEDRQDLARPGAATQMALAAAAERLFGEHGIDAVSLIAVAREAGQGNKYAVQYHFGSKEGLLQAILRTRSDIIEVRRGELLVEAATAGTLDDLPTLVRALFLPVIEQCDPEGHFTFARFLLQYLNHPRYPGGLAPLAEIRQQQVFTTQLMHLLRRQMPALSDELLEWRFMMVLRFVVSCLVSHEAIEAQGTRLVERSGLFDEVLTMATAAMTAPTNA